jgi:hypothetical protein
MMNDSPPLRQQKPFAGLCNGCAEARVIQSDRGSSFLRCGRADRDVTFARYPVLPVLACRGYKQADSE